MRVESGPAKWDYYRYLIMTLMFVGWWAYCYYDGTWGWVNKNRREARKQLAPIVAGARQIPSEFGEVPTKPDFDQLENTRPEITELRRRFGEPFHSAPGAQPGDTIEYYVSDYGMMKVVTRLNRVKAGGIEWVKWYKPKSEIELQIYLWGPLGLVLGAITGFYFVRTARFRMTIDDRGLTYGGKFIPFEDMTGFSNYSPKGWVDLNHSGGKPLRLDNQRVAKFDEAIDAICQVKGFPDPRAPSVTDEGVAEPPAADAGHGD